MKSSNVALLVVLIIVGVSSIFEQKNIYLVVAKILALLILVAFISKNIAASRQKISKKTKNL
jgi:uncharacterized membrane protein